MRLNGVNRKHWMTPYFSTVLWKAWKTARTTRCAASSFRTVSHFCTAYSSSYCESKNRRLKCYILSSSFLLSPPANITWVSWAVMIVWRIRLRGKNIRPVECCFVYRSFHSHKHTQVKILFFFDFLFPFLHLSSSFSFSSLRSSGMQVTQNSGLTPHVCGKCQLYVISVDCNCEYLWISVYCGYCELMTLSQVVLLIR